MKVLKKYNLSYKFVLKMSVSARSIVAFWTRVLGGHALLSNQVNKLQNPEPTHDYDFEQTISLYFSILTF